MRLALDFSGVAEGQHEDGGVHDSADLAGQKDLGEVEECVEG